jgi:hypothetical protein
MTARPTAPHLARRDPRIMIGFRISLFAGTHA